MKKVLGFAPARVVSHFASGAAVQAADVICYNCPPQWADWASMLKAIKADLGYDIPLTTRIPDSRSRKSSPRRPIRSPTSPIFGVTFGMKAKAKDVLEPTSPRGGMRCRPG